MELIHIILFFVQSWRSCSASIAGRVVCAPGGACASSLFAGGVAVGRAGGATAKVLPLDAARTDTSGAAANPFAAESGARI